MGVIHLRIEAGTGTYQLLTSDNYLRTTSQGGSNLDPHPLFEVRFRSRLTYWRYKQKDGFAPSVINGTSDYLEPPSPQITDQLVTIKPHLLGFNARTLQYTSGLFNTQKEAIVPLPGLLHWCLQIKKSMQISKYQR